MIRITLSLLWALTMHQGTCAKLTEYNSGPTGHTPHTEMGNETSRGCALRPGHIEPTLPPEPPHFPTVSSVGV